MFENTRRNVGMIGAGAALTLCLAGGAAAGVVPKIGPAANVSESGPAAPEAAVAPVVTEAPPSTTPPTTPPPAPAAPAPAPTTPRATTPKVAPVTEAPAPEEAAAPAAPPAPTKAPRLTPSSAQVQAAIASLRGLIPFVTPTEAQARQFGNAVCDAFDAGQTFAQVKANAAQAASQIPLVSVSSATIDSAVRTAVSLFCPGYSSKLV